MAILRKPKKKKYPKDPKANASAEQWASHRAKIAEINAEYETKLAEYNRDVSAREQYKTDVKDLKKGKKVRITKPKSKSS